MEEIKHQENIKGHWYSVYTSDIIAFKAKNIFRN